METPEDKIKLVKLEDGGVGSMKNGVIIDRIIAMETYILNPNCFLRKYMRSGEDFQKVINNIKSPENVIYCSVSFGEPDKTYYYQTDDDTILIGEKVIVPVWPEDNGVPAYVQKVQYFDKRKVPFPLSKTKHIIRKANEENGLCIPFQKLMLYKKISPLESQIIIAVLSPARFVILGQEFGYDPFITYKREDTHEYKYSFNRENTQLLFSLLSSDQKEIKPIFLEMFGGKNGCQGLSKFCNDNGIEYTFSVEY